MDPEIIKKYVRVMEENKLLELDIEWDGQKLRMRKIYESARQQKVVTMPAPISMPATEAKPAKAGSKKKSGPKDDIVFKSPMVGTFFRSPAPDKPPLVEPGAKVDEKTVIGLVEAMKVMNEVKAGMNGTIVQIVATDGASVEYGQPLFIIKPA